MTLATSSSPLTRSLDLLADTYNYNHWIFSLLRQYLGAYICEVGAGIGNLTRFFLSARRIEVIEPDHGYYTILKDLASDHLNLAVFQGSLEDYVKLNSAPRSVDTVVCVNVLEHMQKHDEALRIMAGMLIPGGCILLYVPACPWAYGALDMALGHYRRYSSKAITSLAKACGLSVVVSRHVNFIGAFGWWWCSRMRRDTEIKISNARLVDRFVPYLSALERLIPPRIGQSLFVVLKRTQDV
jgi:SAM-dependent methyltransferase